MSDVQFAVALCIVSAAPDTVATMLEVVSPDMFGVMLRDVQHRTRLEHHNVEAPLGEYLRSCSAGRPRTNDTNLVHLRRPNNLKKRGHYWKLTGIRYRVTCCPSISTAITVAIGSSMGRFRR